MLDQYQDRPVYVVDSTFTGGTCSNGGALSSIGVSWQVLNSVLTGNQATGWGANPASSGSPGGGSGAAIYTDGDQYSVTVAGTLILIFFFVAAPPNSRAQNVRSHSSSSRAHCVKLAR